MTLEPMIDLIGNVPIFHGERAEMDPEHSEACLCGFEPYYTACLEWLNGGGIGSLTLYPLGFDGTTDAS